MKVGIISNLYFPYKIGGAEFMAQTISEGLRQNGYDVFVITLDRENKIEFINGIKVYRLKLKNIYWPWDNNFILKSFLKPIWHFIDSYNPFIINDLGKILDLEKPDLIECHNLSGFSVSVWREIKKRNIPLIQVLHDYYNICAKSTMFNGVSNCEKQCMICELYRVKNKKYSNLVDCVIAVSNFVLNKHIQNGFFVKSKKMVIHNGFSHKNIIPSGRNLKDIDGDIIFGYIGRLSHNKGLDLLIDTFTKLENKNVKLFIAGDGEKKYVLSLKKKANEKIFFLGYVDKYKFLSQIDYLIVPSLLNDSFPTVVLEAISFGKPVIASKRGGIPEIINNGVEGFLFNPDTPEELLNAILKVMEFLYNEYKLYSQRCIKRANLFTLDKMIKAHIGVINELGRKI